MPLAGIVLDNLVQGPAPALAIGLGLLPLPHPLVVNRISFFIDRGSQASPVLGVSIAVVRQLGNIAQVLESPGFLVAAAVEQGRGKSQVETGSVLLVLFGGDQGQCLHVKLQGAKPVAFHAVDNHPSPTPLASLELAGHTESPVLHHQHLVRDMS